MIRLFCLFLMAFCLAGCASDTKMLSYGEQSFQQCQYDKAFYLLMPLAQKGNPDAQYAVGYMYFYGKGVVEDSRQAQYWINKAAKQGQPLAIQALQAQCALQSSCPQPAVSPYQG